MMLILYFKEKIDARKLSTDAQKEKTDFNNEGCDGYRKKFCKFFNPFSGYQLGYLKDGKEVEIGQRGEKIGDKKINFPNKLIDTTPRRVKNLHFGQDQAVLKIKIVEKNFEAVGG